MSYTITRRKRKKKESGGREGWHPVVFHNLKKSEKEEQKDTNNDDDDEIESDFLVIEKSYIEEQGADNENVEKMEESMETIANDLRVVDAILRSCAAPTYFSSFQGYVDGGVAANCPCLLSLSTVLHTKKVKMEEIKMMSIGTGTELYICFSLVFWHVTLFSFLLLFSL